MFIIFEHTTYLNYYDGGFWENKMLVKQHKDLEIALKTDVNKAFVISQVYGAILK